MTEPDLIKRNSSEDFLKRSPWIQTTFLFNPKDWNIEVVLILFEKSCKILFYKSAKTWDERVVINYTKVRIIEIILFKCSFCFSQAFEKNICRYLFIVNVIVNSLDMNTANIHSQDQDWLIHYRFELIDSIQTYLHQWCY